MLMTKELLSPIELAQKCHALLNAIANTAAKMLTIKKRADVPIHANIITLRKFRHSDDVRYEVAGHSNNVVREKFANTEPPRLEQNALFHYILNKRGRQDFCLVDDIEEFLKVWAKEWDCPEPHPFKAPSIYKSTLIVAIKGPRPPGINPSEYPDEQVTEVYDDREFLFGFLCVDSKAGNAFDADWDLEILRSAANEAYEALQLWYVTYAAGNHSALRLVSK